MGVPERFRGVLEPFIGDLKAREIISGIGLFGSWSRGDASPSSDLDLLIIEGRDFDYEYLERIELNDCLIDLNYVPKSWIVYRVPPELDQKLYELQVIFDRDGSLTKAKNLMSKVYWRPERVEIRTEAYLIEADTYLSRARTAFNRGDYKSVKVNSIRSFWALMKILTEISRRPVLYSHFIRNLEQSSKSLDMQGLYEDYTDLVGFAGVNRAGLKLMLESLSSAWMGVIRFASANLQTLKSIHPKIATKISYYAHESFLKGLIARVNALIDENDFLEAAHYIFHVMVDMLENYAFLVSTAEGLRFDYAILLRYLSESKKSPIEVYQGAISVLGVREFSSHDADEALKTVTETAVNIRQRRKDLIARFIG